MSLQLLKNISTISYVCSLILFAVAVGLYFYFDIHTVFGYLSGRTRRKRIKESRKKIISENEELNRGKDSKEIRKERWTKSSKARVRQTVVLPETEKRIIKPTMLLPTEEPVIRRRGGTAILTEDMEQGGVSMYMNGLVNGFEGFEIEFEIQGLATDTLVS